MNRVLKLIVAMVALAACAAGLTACSGSSSKTAAAATSSTTGSAPAPSGSAGAGRRGAFADPKVTACLKGAGITLPNRVRPSGSPNGSRSAFPSGSARPSGSRPSGSGFPRGGGFGGNSAQAKKIQVALKACGITLPTGGNRARPSGSGATPSASPTS